MSRRSGARSQWNRQVRARHFEDRLPAPALEESRALSVRSDRLTPTPPRPNKLMRVETDYFVAGAIWEKIGGLWSCVYAAPIIRWMVGRNPDQIHMDLMKMGARWGYVEFLAPEVMGASHEVTA